MTDATALAQEMRLHACDLPLDSRAHDLLIYGADALDSLSQRLAAAERERDEATAAKDGAYLERNRVVAGFAALAQALGYRAGKTRTAIEGWSEEWHGCVFIDLPTGQVSWHFHDNEFGLFEHLPHYNTPWDGHDTPEKYRRVIALTEDDPLNLAAERRNAELARALQNLVERHVSLVSSGDCGFWNVETEAEMVSARAALASQDPPTS